MGILLADIVAESGCFRFPDSLKVIGLEERPLTHFENAKKKAGLCGSSVWAGTGAIPVHEIPCARKMRPRYHEGLHCPCSDCTSIPGAL